MDNANALAQAGASRISDQLKADGMHMPNSTNSRATRAAHACARPHPVTDATPACGLQSAFSSVGIALATEFQSGKFHSFSV